MSRDADHAERVSCCAPSAQLTTGERAEPYQAEAFGQSVCNPLLALLAFVGRGFMSTCVFPTCEDAGKGKFPRIPTATAPSR